MAKFKYIPGVRKESSSPGTIVNKQNHDRSGSQKTLEGTGGTIKEIIADSSVITPVEAGCVLRVVNTDAATQFLFVGLRSEAPGVAPTIANGIALPPDCKEHVFIGFTAAANEGTVIRSSSSNVQVTVLE